MSNVRELEGLIRDASSKLAERQRDAIYWSDELAKLNRELADAQRDEAKKAADKAEKSSERR